MEQENESNKTVTHKLLKVELIGSKKLKHPACQWIKSEQESS